MSKAARGAQSEAMFTVEAFKHGWELAKPFHHDHPYDFCIRRTPGDEWETVQVKTAYLHRKVHRVNLRRATSGVDRPYEKGDFDWLFVVCPGMCGECYFIPYEAVGHIKKNFRVDRELFSVFRLC